MKRKADKAFFTIMTRWFGLWSIVFLSIREVCKNKNDMVGKESIEEGEDTFAYSNFFFLLKTLF